MPTSLRARFIFPVDRPPIENGVVTFNGDTITEVGTVAASENITDLGDVALLPGLVNAHTHFEFSYLREPLGRPGIGIVEWIRLIIAERARGDQSRPENVAAGWHESVSSGVTDIGDIATGPGLVPAGVTQFHEVIGFSRARAESSLIALVSKLDDSAGRTNANLQCDASNSYGISPHAPYTVSPILLRALVTAAHRRNLPMAMHIAESREELQLLHDGTGPFQQLLEERSMWDAEAIPHGSAPFDYLTILANAPRALIIHGNYLDDDELQFLATHRDRMSLVYCPRTHAYFRHSPYPLTKALAAGVQVALGTDSRASNPDLNLLSEMRFIARAHPAVDPEEILHMGTLAGAEALGRESEVGSITSGKAANFAAAPLPGDFTGNAQDALLHVLSGNEPVSAIWLRGKHLQPTIVRSPPLDGEG
jgi:cytosine/adenosine deaminase-related metal-dependent hydrolase